jgi:endonuclease G
MAKTKSKTDPRDGALRRFGPVAVPAGMGVTARRVAKRPWPIEDYAGRGGYDPAFVDATKPLPLPGTGNWEVAEVDPAALRPGDDPHELKYTHFSVKVSTRRRLPLFSAVNIDGAKSDRTVKRTNVWRFDPRIGKEYQIVDGVYGDDGRGFFSRGHMTRREDPNWGDKKTAKLADADTFHATNACPQRQEFNGGIWLDLENYVLDNTDQENIRVTVITGPVFDEDDPVYYDVPIPLGFWKIIVFTNAATRALTALGYQRSQARVLPTRTRALVFGDFQDTQVSIAGLARETGLDLSRYAALDVFERADPGMRVKLASVRDLYLTP